jgi:hypothetical protein
MEFLFKPNKSESRPHLFGKLRPELRILQEFGNLPPDAEPQPLRDGAEVGAAGVLSPSTGWMTIYGPRGVRDILEGGAFRFESICDLQRLFVQDGGEELCILVTDHALHISRVYAIKLLHRLDIQLLPMLYRPSSASWTYGEATVSRLLEEDTSWPVGDLVLRIDSSRRRHPMEEYIRGGYRLSVTYAIDFSEDGGNHERTNALHFSGRRSGEHKEPNAYEQVLRSTWDILLGYGADKPLHAYGFSATVEGAIDESPWFPLKRRHGIFDDGGGDGCNGIDEVLDEYRHTLYNVKLSQSSFMAQVVKEADRIAQHAIQERAYTILIVITRGDIRDAQETSEAIVTASSRPLSIVIIGVGDGYFGTMRGLDGDQYPVHEAAQRDIVQFVHYNTYKNEPVQLREEVMDEIPRQVSHAARPILNS